MAKEINNEQHETYTNQNGSELWIQVRFLGSAI